MIFRKNFSALFYRRLSSTVIIKNNTFPRNLYLGKQVNVDLQYENWQTAKVYKNPYLKGILLKSEMMTLLDEEPPKAINVDRSKEVELIEDLLDNAAETESVLRRFPDSMLPGAMAMGTGDSAVRKPAEDVVGVPPTSEGDDMADPDEEDYSDDDDEEITR